MSRLETDLFPIIVGSVLNESNKKALVKEFGKLVPVENYAVVPCVLTFVRHYHGMQITGSHKMAKEDAECLQSKLNDNWQQFKKHYPKLSKLIDIVTAHWQRIANISDESDYARWSNIIKDAMKTMEEDCIDVKAINDS